MVNSSLDPETDLACSLRTLSLSELPNSNDILSHKSVRSTGKLTARFKSQRLGMEPQRLPIKRKASDYFSKCDIRAGQLVQIGPESIVASAGCDDAILKSVVQFADNLKTAATAALDDTKRSPLVECEQ